MSRLLHCARAGETLLSRLHKVPEACGGAHAMQEWEDVFKFVIMALAVAVFVAIGIELVIGWRLPARLRAGARSLGFEWARAARFAAPWSRTPITIHDG